MSDNIVMDGMMTEATATLYAMEHEEIVKDNFDTLYDLLVSSKSSSREVRLQKASLSNRRMRCSVLLRSFGSAFRGQVLIIGLTGIM